ncbi:MAG: TetR/AcrR family transcriptional regulator [Candidatus Izemoplasmatales bacterium]|nr:TetR/AcrR family transcriptional regulator [Candidatus Izemoplasmatales bacterium]
MTFHHLPEEKREAILSAARREFSRVPFAKTSINRIIQEAGIPRGSFYMYFEDKEDLLKIVLQSMMDEIKITLMASLMQSGGQLRATALQLHDHMYGIYQSKENQDFMKNMMLYFQSTVEQAKSENKGEQPFKDKLFRLIPLLDESQFADPSLEGKKAAVDIVFSVLKSVMVNSFMKEQTMDESREMLIRYLDIIENGYLRK